MNQDVLNTFYALLTVAGQLGLVLCGALWLPRGRTPWWSQLRQSVAPAALWLATLVAGVAVFGSLQLSLGAGYTPCTMCWYHRIAIYPLVVVCGVAALRRDSAVRFTVWPLAAIGAGISTWHYIHERVPETVGGSCDPTAPCSILWIWKLHYISIPMMAFTTMALIATLVAMAPRSEHAEATSSDTQTSPATPRGSHE